MPLGVQIGVGRAATPDPELASATEIEVVEQIGEATTYRIRFPIEILGEDWPSLVDPRFDPGADLAVSVPVGDRLQCLVKGPVQGQLVHLVRGGGRSWMDVRGADSTVRLDAEVREVQWDGVTDADIVKAILAPHGYRVDVEPTAARHEEAGHTLIQLESDLSLVRRLAARNGAYFWVESDPAGVEKAHFRRPSLDGTPVAVLDINPPSGSLHAVDIEWELCGPTGVAALQLDLGNKQVIDGSATDSGLRPMGATPYARIAKTPRTARLEAAVDSAGDLLARSRAALADGQWFVRARTTVRFGDLGTVLRPYTLVNLTGAGTRHGGKYLVWSVRHRIDSEAHVMTVELTRNAWGLS